VSRNSSNELAAVCQFPLSANKERPIAATNHRAGFQLEMWENTAMVVLDVDQLSAITSLQRDTKITFFVLAAETSFSSYTNEGP
jgi:hypothetical protein